MSTFRWCPPVFPTILFHQNIPRKWQQALIYQIRAVLINVYRCMPNTAELLSHFLNPVLRRLYICLKAKQSLPVVWSSLEVLPPERCERRIRTQSIVLTLSLKITTHRTFILALTLLTQTVCRGIHNLKFKLRELILEVKPGLRCVSHAGRGVSEVTLGTPRQRACLETRIPETWTAFL